MINLRENDQQYPKLSIKRGYNRENKLQETVVSATITESNIKDTCKATWIPLN